MPKADIGKGVQRRLVRLLVAARNFGWKISKNAWDAGINDSFGKPKDTDATRHCRPQGLHCDRRFIRRRNSRSRNNSDTKPALYEIKQRTELVDDDTVVEYDATITGSYIERASQSRITGHRNHGLVTDVFERHERERV